MTADPQTTDRMKFQIPNLMWNLKHVSSILLLDTLFPSAYDEEMVAHPKIEPVSEGGW